MSNINKMNSYCAIHQFLMFAVEINPTEEMIDNLYTFAHLNINNLENITVPVDQVFSDDWKYLYNIVNLSVNEIDIHIIYTMMPFFLRIYKRTFFHDTNDFIEELIASIDVEDHPYKRMFYEAFEKVKDAKTKYTKYWELES